MTAPYGDGIFVHVEVRHADDELMPVQEIQGHFQFGPTMENNAHERHMAIVLHTKPQFVLLHCKHM